MKRLLFAIALCGVLSANLFAQTNILRELLDLPAPPPANESDDEAKRPTEFFDDKNPPADDAPVEDLIDYWNVKANAYYSSGSKAPTASVKSALRLIAVVNDAPYKFNGFLKILPLDTEVLQNVKQLYDAKQASADVSDYWREEVKKWLKFNSDFYVEELLSDARAAKDHPKYSSVIKEEELRALAKFDWENAQEVLEKLKDDRANPRSATLAKRLFYEHALAAKNEGEAEKYRSQLKAIVEDKNTKPTARDAAMEALAKEDWQGRDDWYVSLLEDETLLNPTEGVNLFSPLTTISEKNPDKWIPILTKLIGNKNRAVHNAAVQGLINFEKRKDALEPLLPWLSNPDWADARWSGSDRTAYMQLVADVDLPESVPGLIWIVENDEDNLHWAARSLAHYKDARAIPALRNALEKSKEEDDRNEIVNALIACGGLSDGEQMSALEAYAEYVSVPANFEAIKTRNEYDDENPLPVAVSIGNFLSKQKEPQENLIRLAIERQKILQKEKPAVAKILSNILSGWRGRLIDLEMLNRIADGRADAETIVGALARRKDLSEKFSGDISAMRGRGGLGSAVAACFSDDESDAAAAFHSSDAETKIAALACARLLRKPLPVSEVGGLLKNPNKLLALAAERYLDAEDSRAARDFVLSVHPNEALILGARDSFNPAKTIISSDYLNPNPSGLAESLQKLFSSVSGTYLYPENYYSFNRDFDKYEEKLRKEILEDKNVKEIYASSGDVLKVYQDNHAVLTWSNDAIFAWSDDEARYRERVLTKEELESFYRYVSENNLDERKPFVYCVSEVCGMGEFVMLNRSGGRRIFSYGAGGSGVWMSAVFSDLQTEDAKVHYRFEKYVSGLEILLADENFQPKAIWKNGDDFRVLVSDEARKRQIEDELDKQYKADDENEEMDYEEKNSKRYKRRVEREFEHYEWREFKNGKLGEQANEPAEVPFLRDKLSFPDLENLSSNKNIRQTKSGGYEIRAGEFSVGGLWKVNRAEKIEFKKGNYMKPVVAGNWVVAAKADENWAVPNYVVRINLQTGKESKINLPPADEFYPVAFVAAHNKVLLYRARGDDSKDKNNPSPLAPEYYLLDAATGKTELARGEFRPLIQQTFRSLQTTGKPDEFWAAIYNRAENKTDVGVYNAKDFTFKSVLTLPEIALDSMDVWADAAGAKIYFIFGDRFGREPHLLGVPLPPEK